MNSKNIAIKVENLSKRYRIGLKEKMHESFVGAIADFAKRPLQNYRKYRSLYKFDELEPENGQNSTGQPADIIWALKDVSFEVERGDVLGIIGRNGAGKSTLLKILSRITDPTSGRVEIHGRISSLLEVGTGFHEELTGRENVYLNGTILGMRKTEVDRKFDEIVAFSGVEKFLDTPVKRYSSGMKVRLAFSVAAHLQPDILVVDEVLAVGDVEFQKKCLGKMEGVAKEGRTILFVSHNMLAIQSLCTRAIVLDGGAVSFSGSTQQAVAKYIESVDQLQKQPLDLRHDRVGGETFRFDYVDFVDPETMTPCNVLVAGQPVLIRIGYLCKSPSKIKDVGVGIAFFTMNSTQLCGCRSRAVGVPLEIHPGKGYTDCIIPRWPFKSGRYFYHLFAERNGSVLDWVTDAGTIDVETSDYYGTGCLPSEGQPGVLIDYMWKDEVNDPTILAT